MNKVNRAIGQVALCALLLPASGCFLFGDHCDDFNPYKDYERLKRPDDDDSPKEAVKPGKFRLACYNLGGDEKLIEQAISEALRDSGGGSVTQLSQAEAETNMLDYSRGAGGPYENQKPRVGRYEVVFRSKDLGESPPLNATWKGTSEVRKFKVNEEGSPVTLLELGEEQYKLIFTAEANLRCSGEALISAGKGKYRFKRPLFELTTAAGDKRVEAEVITDKEVAEVKEPPIKLYEVTSFSGHVSEFLCKLLYENRILDTSNKDEDPWIAEFAMKETTIWLDAQVGQGGVKTRIRANWTQASTNPARDLTAEVPGAGQFSEGEDAARDYSLKSTYDEDRDQVTITFELGLSQQQFDKIKDDLYVTFKYTIDGAQQSQRVKAEPR